MYSGRKCLICGEVLESDGLVLLDHTLVNHRDTLLFRLMIEAAKICSQKNIPLEFLYEGAIKAMNAKLDEDELYAASNEQKRNNDS